jgi:hypothetical protein
MTRGWGKIGNLKLEIGKKRQVGVGIPFRGGTE